MFSVLAARLGSFVLHFRLLLVAEQSGILRILIQGDEEKLLGPSASGIQINDKIKSQANAWADLTKE